jgi:hypothetical protein
VSVRRPGQLAPAAPAVVPLDWTAPGRDPELAAAQVAGAGGDPDAFRGFLAAALPLVPADARDADVFTALAGIAGWRAGVRELREDALDRIDALRDAVDSGRAAAAALGLTADELGEFVERQRGGDRFWWPGRAAAGGYVCAVGGFAGLGGVWTVPPDAWRSLDAPGVYAVRAGEWWQVEVDVWGQRVHRMPSAPGAGGPARSDGIQFVLRPDTHLAWLHVAAA